MTHCVSSHRNHLYFGYSSIKQLLPPFVILMTWYTCIYSGFFPACFHIDHQQQQQHKKTIQQSLTIIYFQNRHELD